MKRLVLGSLILLGAALPALANNVKTLPPEVYGQLKRGKKLDLVYVSPKFNPATGFTLGSVTTQIDESYQGIYADTIHYFPTALRKLVDPGSPNVLDLVVIDFKITDLFGKGSFIANMKVEGQIKGPDGELLMAFVTRREESARENLRADCNAVMDTIAWQLYKDLGPKYQKAAAARLGGDAVTLPAAVTMAPKAAPPNPAPAAPQQAPAAPQQALAAQPAPQGQTPADPTDARGRLLRLKGLLEQGLITQEEYQAKREEILKNL